MTYVPVRELAGRPHVVVDGAPRPGTCCTLSHWPRTPTPAALRGDTSAAIVLDALAHPGQLPRTARRCATATIDHLDEDGVISLALLCRPDLAEAFGERLVAAAGVGDFGVASDDDAARIAFALGTVLGRSPAGNSAQGGRDVVGATLDLLPDLVAHPGRHRELWGAPWEKFVAARAAIETGRVGIEEDEGRDLAVVRVDTDIPADARGAWATRPVHRVALHSATVCTRILTIAGPGAGERQPGAVDLAYRYETWVRLAAPLERPRRPRVAGPSAAALTELDGSAWDFPGVAALAPVLARRDRATTTLPFDDVLALVRRHLDDADALPPAWDPWA